MKQWLLGIVLTAFAGGLARQLAPSGREQAMVRLVGGLLLTLAILRPLAGLDWEGPALEAGSFQSRTAEQAEIYRKNQQEALAAIIAEKTGAYIWDKANQLGLACQVTVATAATWPAAKGSTTADGPTTTRCRSGSAARARAAPASTTSGPKSPPMASTMIFIEFPLSSVRKCLGAL